MKAEYLNQVINEYSHFREYTEVLEIVGNTDEGHGVASKSTFIQFKKHISSNNQPANQAVLQAKRSFGDINVRSLLRDVRMNRPSRIGPAGRASRVGGAGAVPKTRVRMRDEFRAAEQTLTVNIKRGRQSFHDTNIGAHNVDQPVWKLTLSGRCCASRRGHYVSSGERGIAVPFITHFRVRRDAALVGID